MSCFVAGAAPARPASYPVSRSRETSSANPLWSDPWLADASPGLVEALEGAAVTRTLSDGQILYARGDAAAGLVGVRRGLVRHVAALQDGREVIAGLFPAGSWFGEISLFDERPRPFDCFAVGETEVRLVSTARLRALLDANPLWYRDFARLLCLKLRLAFDHIEAGFLPLAVRVARRLLDLAEVYGRVEGTGIRIDLRLSQSDLASMLGISRQHANRELKAMQARGWIDLSPGRIVLLERDALMRFARDAG